MLFWAALYNYLVAVVVGAVGAVVVCRIVSGLRYHDQLIA